jgi:NAD(P)-dependent dehydrogenase (short-subunit alcohol dehydrogenase family)
MGGADECGEVTLAGAGQWDALDGLRPSRLFSLDGRVALVTGAGGGVGGWLVLGLAAAGARVVLSDISTEKCADLTKILDANHRDFSVIPADLRDGHAPSAIVRHVVATFGRLDVLVNNAGVNTRQPVHEVTLDSWDVIGDVNLKAGYFLCREAMPVMREHNGGSIINITSVNSEIGIEGVSVYGAHKAAMTQVSKVMCVEWARYGIRVNCIAPGFLMTALSRPLWNDEVRSSWILDRCPLNRPGEPAELIGACLLLASDAGSFITGSTVHVDGGFLAGSPWHRERGEHP